MIRVKLSNWRGWISHARKDSSERVAAARHGRDRRGRQPGARVMAR